MMLGTTTCDDWICVKVPFKGRLSDLKSISFSLFVAQPGGTIQEPCIIVKLSEGKRLICDPVSSYENGTWYLPLLEWQLRDVASRGTWTYTIGDTNSATAPLTTWILQMGDSNVLGIDLLVGRWTIEGNYQCFIGDLSVNGKAVDLSNAARAKGSLTDLPPGF
jgi:hypothetical protein